MPFDAAWRPDQDPTNLQWQKEMALLFEPVAGLKPGERFAMVEEAFYLGCEPTIYDRFYDLHNGSHGKLGNPIRA